MCCGRMTSAGGSYDTVMRRTALSPTRQPHPAAVELSVRPSGAGPRNRVLRPVAGRTTPIAVPVAQAACFPEAPSRQRDDDSVTAAATSLQRGDQPVDRHQRGGTEEVQAGYAGGASEAVAQRLQLGRLGRARRRAGRRHLGGERAEAIDERTLHEYADREAAETEDGAEREDDALRRREPGGNEAQHVQPQAAEHDADR